MLAHKLEKFIPTLLRKKTSRIGSIFQSFKETSCIKKRKFKINLKGLNQVDRNVFERREKQLSETYPITDHIFDVVIVGAGSAGLMCANQLAKEGYHVACISKTIPAESQSALTSKGISAALDEKDDWKYHAYDLIRHGDWLGDQNAIHYMCKEAPHVVNQILANEMCMPFTKTEEGKIYQINGGTKKFGKGGLVRRNCMAEGETGRHLIETAYQSSIKNNVKFFIGFFGMDLLMNKDNTSCRGVISYNMNDSSLHRFKSHYTVLATGGYGRAYSTSACSPNCTGDGTAMISRAGLQNQDMEFVQFHSTGIFRDGWMIESNMKGETGIVINGEGNRAYDIAFP